MGIKEKTNLQTKVMDLEADAERYQENIKQLENKIMQAHE
jgi:hypothetical protein